MEHQPHSVIFREMNPPEQKGLLKDSPLLLKSKQARHTRKVFTDPFLYCLSSLDLQSQVQAQ